MSSPFLALRSANSGAPFVADNDLDTLLWSVAQQKWTTGAGSGGAVASVFARVGNVVALTGDYDSDQITNLSGVAGASVSDALDQLALASGAVSSVFGRAGAVIAVAGDYTSTQVTNSSGVTGATVTAALNTLDARVTGVSSVFGRTGAVIAAAGDYTASQIINTSTVAGVTVADALDTLGASVGGVSSVFGRAGAVVAVAGDYTSTQVTNSSGVVGATVTAALNTLDARVTGVSSVFGRTGAVVAGAGDYTSTQVTNSSGVTGATVTAALNTLNTAVGAAVPTSRTITATTPVRIDGGASADLSANRTLSVLPVSNTTAGVAPLVPGTVGLALISSATASAWGSDFGANNLTTTGAFISNLAAGFVRVGLAPGSGAGSGAGTGSIRLPNGTFVGTVQGRNNADTGDIILLGWNSSGLDTQFGSNASGGNNTATASAIASFRVRLTTSATVVFAISTTAMTFSGINSVAFDPTPTVTFSQQAVTGAGKAFTYSAQGGTTTGGDLVIVGGGAGAAGNAGGSVQLVPGKGSGDAGNINLGKATTPVFNGLKRGLFVSDAEAAAAAAPIGGSYVYGFAGGGTARSPTSTFSAVWAHSATGATNGTIINYPKADQVSLAANAAASNIVTWDMSAPGYGLPAIDGASIRIQATIIILGTAGGYGRIDLVADFKRLAGVLSQIGTSTVVYSAFDAAIAAAVGTIDFTGQTIRLRGDASVGAGVPAANWSGQLYLSTTSF